MISKTKFSLKIIDSLGSGIRTWAGTGFNGNCVPRPWVRRPGCPGFRLFRRRRDEVNSSGVMARAWMIGRCKGPQSAYSRGLGPDWCSLWIPCWGAFSALKSGLGNASSQEPEVKLPRAMVDAGWCIPESFGRAEIEGDAVRGIPDGCRLILGSGRGNTSRGPEILTCRLCLFRR